MIPAHKVQMVGARNIFSIFSISDGINTDTVRQFMLFSV